MKKSEENCCICCSCSAADSFSVSRNGLTRVDLEVLDATTLFEKTGSMPIYSVIKGPAAGELVKVASKSAL